MLNNRQLTINIIATSLAFVVNFGINFFLTPFIVSSLGATAYGFVGLSTNILGYTQLITIALNSMAGRFITIKYAQNDIESANKYLSSVYYSNLIISGGIVLIMTICIAFLDKLFEVPPSLINDVKLLFSFLTINTILGLITNVYSIATFIKNRLELSSIRQIIGYIIRGLGLISLFSFYSPHLWYVGITGLFVTIYTGFANYYYTKTLTPELSISRKSYDWNKVKELIVSGIWNLITKLGEILQRGLDLVFANVFIGAKEMGILSLTTQIPFIILQFFSTLSSNFAPSMTILYATNDMDSIKHELSKSVRILSMVMLPPLTILYVFGDSFYDLWLPSQDATLLQWLTICGTFALIFTSPLESFWNIFTVTNKIKVSSLFMIANSVAVFITVVVLLSLTKDKTIQMFIIASTRSLWGIIRGTIFLPLYGAKCLGLKKTYFYPSIIRPISGLIATIVLISFLKQIITPTTWMEFALVTVCVGISSIAIGAWFILSSSDILYIRQKIYDKVKK